MTNNNMIDWENVFRNSNTFKNNKPFPYGFVENFFHEDFYNELYNTYPKLDEKWFIPTDASRSAKKRWFGMADYNSEQRNVDQEDSSLSVAWNQFFHYIHSKEFLGNMSRYSGIELTGFTHFGFIVNEKGSFNMPHTHHPTEQKKDYGYNLTLLVYFAKGWKHGDPGGTYLASDEDESSILFEPYNLDNTCVIFAETPKSFHGSRYMTQDAKRQSIQFTLI